MPVLESQARGSEIVTPSGSAGRPHPTGLVILDFMIRSRVHLWPGAALIIWALPPWYGLPPTWNAVPSITLAGFGLFQVNRVFDSAEDEINDPAAYARIAASRRAVRSAGVVAILASLFLSMMLIGSVATATLSILLLLGVLYSVPFFRQGQGEPRRLKQIAGLKNTIPAVVWSATTVLYPAMSRAGIQWLPFLLVLAGVFCIVFTIEVAWDIRDARGDRAAGIRTLATTFGVRRALLGPIAASSLLAVAIVGLVLLRTLPWLWLLPAFLLVVLPSVAYALKESLAIDRARSDILALVNVLALVPMSLVGRWPAS